MNSKSNFQKENLIINRFFPLGQKVGQIQFRFMKINELYFYTTTIKNWKPIIRDLKLEPIIIDSFSYLHKKGCIKIYGFVIMPNHVHLIWECKNYNGKESPASSFKKYTSRIFLD